MLTRIRNATTVAPSARRHAALPAQGGDRAILESEGYIQGFKVIEPKDGERQGTLRVLLKYGPRGERVITGIERVSRPGRRVYFGRDERAGRPGRASARSILTTSRGVMTGREAVKAGVGGEVLCNVW